MVVVLEEFVPLSLPFLSNKLFRTRWLMHSFVPSFLFAEASRRTNEQIETPTRLACLLSLPNLVSQSTFPACSSIPARTRSSCLSLSLVKFDAFVGVVGKKGA